MSYPVLMVPAGDVIPILFGTYAGATGASITLTGLAVTDIEIYRDGSVTQRASDAGYTLLDTDGIDFDGITGIHGFSINTGDNTDAGFYTVGAWFTVVVSAITVDGQTVNFIAAMFRLMEGEGVVGVPEVNVTRIDGNSSGGTALLGLAQNLVMWDPNGELVTNTGVGGTGNDTTHVHLDRDALWGDDELNDQLIVITTWATGESHSRWITNFVGATSLATLDSALPFTPNPATDSYTLFSIRRPHTTTVAAIETDTQDIQARLPAALVGGRIDATVDATGMEAGAIDAILNRAITEGYAADGAAPTLAQGISEILAILEESNLSGTTITVKKRDGSTTAFTLTLDDATNPTTITRAT